MLYEGCGGGRGRRRKSAAAATGHSLLDLQAVNPGGQLLGQHLLLRPRAVHRGRGRGGRDGRGDRGRGVRAAVLFWEFLSITP